MASVVFDTPSAIPVPSGIRLIATDLDGTLLLPDGSVGPRTRAALDALRASDLDLVIATGRPPRWISPVVEMTGHRGVGIGANGGVVLDLADGVVTEIFAIAVDDGAEVVERLQRELPGVVFAVERARVGARLAPTGGQAVEDASWGPGDASEFALGEGYVPRWAIPPGVTPSPIEELIAGGDVVKVLVRPGPEVAFSIDQFLVRGQEILQGLVEVTHSNPNDCLLEVSAPGVTKATTLERVAAAHGHGALHVAAAGDAPNDLEMLAWAGASYAVANAHPLVKEVATHEVPSNAEEGVAQLIEAILAEQSGDAWSAIT